MSGPYRNRAVRSNAISWAIMVRELAAGPCTVAELVAETGLRPETVMGYVRALRRQRAVYIARWDKDSAGRTRVAAYQIGDKPNAKLQRMPRAEKDRRYRARLPMRGLQSAIEGRTQ